MQKIEILGSGCNRCGETYRVVRHVVEREGIDADVIKDESIERMMALGVMSTPAVVVDGRVVIAGYVPKAEEVRRLLGAPEA